MTVVFNILATNDYLPLGVRLVKKLKKHATFDYKVNLISNDLQVEDYFSDRFKENLRIKYATNTYWVEAMYMKFNFMLKSEGDFIFYLDADTDLNRPLYPGAFYYDLVGAQHFADRFCMIKNKNYDRNPRSQAFIQQRNLPVETYYQGAFFGGRRDKVRMMCHIIQGWKRQDRLINYEPAVNDESYINRYFYEKPHHTIECKHFPFVISDKGGLGMRRDKIAGYNKIKLANYRDSYINIREGQILICE